METFQQRPPLDAPFISLIFSFSAANPLMFF